MAIVHPHDTSGWRTLLTVGDATVDITESRPRSGRGSLEFSQSGQNAGADFGLFWSDPARTLGGLTDVQFDWRRSADSTAEAQLAPALRLHYDVDADLATTADRGALIWEWKHNSEGPAPVEAWQTADLIDDHFWMFEHAPGEPILDHDVTLAGWAEGGPAIDPALGADPLTKATLITGIELASGNGWPGAFHGFVDNVVLGFGTDDLILANFEPLAPSPFTTGDDRMDLNDFELAALANATDALAGDDRVRLSEQENPGVPFFAGDGDDVVRGSAAGDLVEGGAGADRLLGRAGDDQLEGGDGPDHLAGNPGNDRLDGGADDDRLLGGNDADHLLGGDGADLLRGGSGHDTLAGGGGDDELRGEKGHDQLDGGTGDDLLIGGGSQDIFLISGDGPGHDRILDFRSGVDVVRLVDVLDAGGSPLRAFADLDATGDGRLDPADAALDDTGAGLVLSFGGGSLELVGAESLSPADIAFV